MKKIVYAPGIRDVKSVHSAGIRSIPKAQRSMYLELFIMAQEKERVAKEHFLVSKRHRSLNKQLMTLNRRIEKLQENLVREQKDKADKASAGCHKKMKVKY